MTVRLAIFDCDGTLVDSQANIIECMAETFAKHRLDAPDRHAVRRVVGLSLAEAMAALLPGAEADFHDRLAEDYKLAFQSRRTNGGLAPQPLYPGVRGGLLQLERGGWLLGVATGKSDRGLALTLLHHETHGRFVTRRAADRHPPKPHPSMIQTAMAETGTRPEDTVMIGDRMDTDIIAGVNSGMETVLVLTGVTRAGEVDRFPYRPNAIVESIAAVALPEAGSAGPSSAPAAGPHRQDNA